MAEEEPDGPPAPAESDSAKELRDKLGGRTIALALVSMVALVELMIIVRLAVK